MWVKKQQLEPYMEQMIGSKLGKEYKVVYFHPVYLTSVQNISCEMLWNQDCQEKYQQLTYAGDTTLMAQIEGKLKSLFSSSLEREEWKS